MKLTTSICKSIALLLLFASGFLCVALAFGEDNSPTHQWLLTHIGLFALGTLSFLAFGKLSRIWQYDDSISETPQKHIIK